MSNRPYPEPTDVSATHAAAASGESTRVEIDANDHDCAESRVPVDPAHVAIGTEIDPDSPKRPTTRGPSTEVPSAPV